MNQSPMISPCLHHLRTPSSPDDRCPEDPSGTPSRLWPRMRRSYPRPARCCEKTGTLPEFCISKFGYLDR